MKNVGTFKSSWLWVLLFAALGVNSLLDALQQADIDLGRLLMGIGFLLAAAHRALNPTRLFEHGGPADSRFDWVGVLGVLALAAGLVVRLF